MHVKRSSVLIALGLFAFGGIAWAQPPKVYSRPVTERNVLRFEVGYFRPSGSSNYWNDTFREFTGSTSDFGDAVFGFDDVMVAETGLAEGADHDLAHDARIVDNEDGHRRGS